MTRPALRAAVIGLALGAVAVLLVCAVLGLRYHRLVSGRAAATAPVSGTVVADDIGVDQYSRVRWVFAGGTYDKVFGIYDMDRYPKGSGFPLLVDPAHPDRAYAADPEETGEDDDLLVPMGFVVFLLAASALAWGWRALVRRRALAREPCELTGTAYAGAALQGAVWVSSCWIGLSRTSRPGAWPDRWQRVMWHPALDDLPGRTRVVVHGDLDGRRRVGVELPDGVRLVPVGRLRHGPPKADLRERSTLTPADLVILPAGAQPPMPASYARTVAVRAAIGLVPGTVLGVAVAAPATAPLFSVAGAAVMVAAWAYAGGEP